MNNLSADLHELFITPAGTALITIYQIYPFDVTELREFAEDEKDPNYIWDCLFQEIDMEKGELVFEWRASDWHALNETYRDIGGGGTLEDPFDWYHINSVEKDELGNYLISARYTHTVTYIDGRTGEIIWVLGGKRNAFKDLSGGNATNFAWQHDARFHSMETFPQLLKDEVKANKASKDNSEQTTQLVTIFDNSAEDQRYTNPISRGLLLEVTYPKVSTEDTSRTADLSKREATPQTSDEYTVRLVRSYENPLGVVSSSQGSVQVLPPYSRRQDPKILVGYGYNAVWTEYAANGTVLCDTHFATNYSWERGDVQSYRAFKFPWIGQPAEPPTAILSEDGGVIYTSWNGATEVRSWILQESKDYELGEEEWQDISEVQKNGFETEIEFDESQVKRYLRIKAVDDKGIALGVSRELDMGWTAVSINSHSHA